MTTLPEQEMFCCALVKANGPKVKWLHTTCHDYWDRLEAKDIEIARLRELAGPTPVEVFQPSDFIQEELETRGWRVEDLAEQAGWTTALTSEVLAGRRVTRLIAYGLAEAFGTSQQLWQNLQTKADTAPRVSE